jgi:ribosome biogenesis GTPase
VSADRSPEGWSLETLGWSDQVARAFEPLARPHVVPGRVALEHKHIYRVFTQRGERLARAAGRLRHQASTPMEYPAVGDWVAVRLNPTETRGSILQVLPRTSRFSRKVAGELTQEQVVAANIDTVFLAMGLDADYNLRRIERYLLTGWTSGAQPVVLLTKADLCDDVEARVREIEAVAAGAPVHATTAMAEGGVDVVRRYLQPGRTVAILGSSGAGKSTLINRIVGKELLRTGDLTADARRGRHTTTSREMIVLPDGGLIIDTPGLREIQLWDAGESLGSAFPDISALAEGCHFNDCAHDSEPRCAVRRAVEEGRLEPDRLESFLKLQAEARRFAEKHDELAILEKKRSAKIFGRLLKRMPKKG